MRAGRLDHKLVLQHYLRSRDEHGADVQLWTDFQEMWGWIEPVSENERFRNDTVGSIVTHKITIRYIRQIRTDFRLIERVGSNTRTFNIVGILNEDERNHTMTVMCQEVRI